MSVRVINFVLVVAFFTALAFGAWYYMCHPIEALPVVGAVALGIWLLRMWERILPKFVRGALMQWRLGIYEDISSYLKRCPLPCLSRFSEDFQKWSDQLWYLQSTGACTARELLISKCQSHMKRGDIPTWEPVEAQEDDDDAVPAPTREREKEPMPLSEEY